MDFRYENEGFGKLVIKGAELNEVKTLINTIKFLHNDKSKPEVAKDETVEEEKSNVIEFRKSEEPVMIRKRLPNSYDENGKEISEPVIPYRFACPTCLEGIGLVGNDFSLVYNYKDNTIRLISFSDGELELIPDEELRKFISENKKDLFNYEKHTDELDRARKIINNYLKKSYLGIMESLENNEYEEVKIVKTDIEFYECPLCGETHSLTEYINKAESVDYNFCPVCFVGEIDDIYTVNGNKALNELDCTHNCLREKMEEV